MGFSDQMDNRRIELIPYAKAWVFRQTVKKIPNTLLTVVIPDIGDHAFEILTADVPVHDGIVHEYLFEWARQGIRRESEPYRGFRVHQRTASQ